MPQSKKHTIAKVKKARGAINEEAMSLFVLACAEALALLTAAAGPDSAASLGNVRKLIAKARATAAKKAAINNVHFAPDPVAATFVAPDPKPRQRPATLQRVDHVWRVLSEFGSASPQVILDRANRSAPLGLEMTRWQLIDTLRNNRDIFANVSHGRWAAIEPHDDVELDDKGRAIDGEGNPVRDALSEAHRTGETP